MWVIGVILIISFIIGIIYGAKHPNEEPKEKSKVDWWTLGMMADIMNKKNKE